MRNKTLLINGKKCFVIKIEHLVTVDVFASALACHFYEQSVDFNERMSRKEAKEILNTELRWGGDNSNYDRNGVFEGATDSNDIYDPIYESAYKWVIKNYPYLNESDRK